MGRKLPGLRDFAQTNLCGLAHSVIQSAYGPLEFRPPRNFGSTADGATTEPGAPYDRRQALPLGLDNLTRPERRHAAVELSGVNEPVHPHLPPETYSSGATRGQELYEELLGQYIPVVAEMDGVSKAEARLVALSYRASYHRS